ncbi:glycosyltransferase family 4 protein [bacterium]|nr:glycosyltransferase family 4 protein [bacterium]
MHIGIDATFLPRDHRGMGMVVRNFLQGWQNLKLDKEHKLTFLTFKPKLLEGIKEECAHLGDCFTFSQAPEDLDVCWYPWDRADVLLPCAKVMTMHDVLVWKEEFKRKKYRDWSVLMHKLDKVATVSQTVKNLALELLGDPLNKITVCHNSINEIFLKSFEHIDLFTEAKRKEFAAKYTDSHPYVVFIGNPVEHCKNILGLIRGLKLLSEDFPNHRILSVGPKPDFSIPFLKKLFPDKSAAYKKELEAELNKNADLVYFTGQLTAEELMHAYVHCDAFTLCSSYEGFCLPLIEAMACSAICIASRDSCIPETGGDVPFYYSPNQPEKFAEVLKQVLQLQAEGDPQDVLKERKKAGMQRAVLFSPTNNAQNMLKIFTEAVEAHKKQN